MSSLHLKIDHFISKFTKNIEYLLSKQVCYYLLDHGQSESILWDGLMKWLHETPENQILEPRLVQLKLSEPNAFRKLLLIERKKSPIRPLVK